MKGASTWRGVKNHSDLSSQHNHHYNNKCEWVNIHNITYFDPGLSLALVWTHLKNLIETSLVVPWLQLCAPKARGPGLIPSRGTRAHILQLTVHMLQLGPVQMNKLKKKKFYSQHCCCC